MGRIRLSRFFSLRGALAGLLAAAVATVTPLVLATPTPASATATGAAAGLAAGVAPGNITSLSDATLAATMSGIAASGATWVRLGVDWPVAEWNQGSFNWATSDRVAQAALTDHLQVEFVVNGSGQDFPGGGSNVPPWAQTCSGGCPSPSAFGSFASAVAQHYSAIGIHTYEIWNEPNLATNWGPRVSPSGYTALLVQAYSAIKAADPQSFILCGGLSPAGDAADGSQMSPQTFLTEMYAAGAGGHMDAVAVHPYSFPADPADSSTASWNFFYNLPNWIYQVMVSNGDGAKKVWLTEFGVPTGTNVAGGAVSEQTQAQQVTDAFTLAANWSWAGPLFYYSWQDGSDPTSTWDNFGLVDFSGNPKPALSAFSAAAARVAHNGTTSTTSTTSTTGTTGTTSTTGSGTTPVAGPSSILPVPTNLVLAVRRSSVTLSWTDPSGTQGVNIYRDGSKISSTGTATGFWDAGVPPGTHTYYVAAFNSSGQGASSNLVAVTINSRITYRHFGVIQIVRG